jgi:hypothetical protein
MSDKLPKTHEFVGDSFDMWQWGQECFCFAQPVSLHWLRFTVIAECIVIRDKL